MRRSIKWIGNLQITANSSTSHDFQNAVLDKFAERTRTSASGHCSKRRLLNVGRLILLLDASVPVTPRANIPENSEILLLYFKLLSLMTVKSIKSN